MSTRLTLAAPTVDTLLPGNNMKLTRRNCLTAASSVLLCPTLTSFLRADTPTRSVATNTYPWLTFARRENEAFELHTDGLLRDIAKTGITGYEPIINSADEFVGLRDRLQRHGLRMHSLYVNSTLHDATRIEQSVANVMKIAAAAQPLGTKIIVTNPSPIQWGGTEDKSDSQLRLQAKTLDELGEALRSQGMTLAYHNHDAELRQGGREFHHMLTATAPENVKLCLDAHWIYRGCGNSEVAVFDALQHYQSRIVELHLRQSVGGHWTEDFRMQGDIDYARIFAALQHASRSPHLVLEQAVEAKSPRTMDVVQAHSLSRQNLK